MKFILITIFALLISSCTTSPVLQNSAININKENKIIANAKDTEKIKLALDKRIEVQNSQCFKDFMLNRQLIDTNLSNEQVLSELNKEVYFEIETYYKRYSKVYGYTYPDTPRIWINKKYFDGATICNVASNLNHEISHKQGFTHSYKATRSRPYSVPYSINAAYEVCCERKDN
jgi:hypothetical protein